MKVETLVEQLLFTTVRIAWSAKSGELHTGTGFFFAYANGTNSHPFIVTNRHVVEGADATTITFHTAKDGALQLGKPYALTVTEAEKFWSLSNDPNVDLAIAPIAALLRELESRGVTPFWRNIDQTLVPDERVLDELDALEDIVFIGYPAPVWDTRNFLPVIRRGITATPLTIDYLGQKQFLVDASVFPGSSGSPVFLLNNSGTYANRAGHVTVGRRFYFLGVIGAVHQQQDFSELKLLPAPTAQIPGVVSNRMINLGIVVKSTKVVELVKEWLVEHGVSITAPPAGPTASPPTPTAPPGATSSP